MVRVMPFVCIATQLAVAVYALHATRQHSPEGVHATLRVSLAWVFVAAAAMVVLTALGGGWPITSVAVVRVWEVFFVCLNLLSLLALYLSVKEYPKTHPLDCGACEARPKAACGTAPEVDRVIGPV